MASQFPIPGAKKISNYVPVLKQQGMDYLTAAGKAGDSMQHARVAQVGAAPFAVTFAGMGMTNMDDATYDVIVQSPAGAVYADYTTRTTTGFSVLGGADTNALTILVMGRLTGQSK